MKRLNNLYNDMCDLNNIIKMTDKVCSRVRNKRLVDRFEVYKAEHIINIKNRLDRKNIMFDKYNIFMITDPKCRVVMSLNIEDKIINHLVSEYILVKTFENKYTDSMIATRKNKGTSYGIKLLKKYLKEIKKEYSNFYFLKIDIKKYFYSIDHNILKNILRKNIKDKDSIKILDNIIDSTNLEYVNKEINELKEKRIKHLKDEDLIKETMNIPLYERGKGVSIGNQTSQNFGLIYLYELNHYIKEQLHIKYLINYMDDFIIIHEDKKYLEYCLDEIKKFLLKYKLEINYNKTKTDSIRNGIDFLGYRFYVNNNKIIIKLRNHIKNIFKSKVKKLKYLIEENYITLKEFNVKLSSYKGLLKYGECRDLYYKYIKNYYR